MTIQTCGDNGLETVQFSQMGIRDALSNGHDEFFFDCLKNQDVSQL